MWEAPERKGTGKRGAPQEGVREGELPTRKGVSPLEWCKEGGQQGKGDHPGWTERRSRRGEPPTRDGGFSSFSHEFGRPALVRLFSFAGGLLFPMGGLSSLRLSPVGGPFNVSCLNLMIMRFPHVSDSIPSLFSCPSCMLRTGASVTAAAVLARVQHSW